MPLEHRLVAATHALVGLLLIGGIWIGLPARYAPVDVLGTGLSVAALVSCVALLLRRRWSLRVARAVCWALLAAGCLTVTALAWSAAHLAGSYGPVGSGGALLMVTIALLIAPYLVGLPALQLRWLRRAA